MAPLIKVQTQEEQKSMPALPTPEMITKENPAVIQVNEQKNPAVEEKTKVDQFSSKMIKANSSPVKAPEENKTQDPSAKQSKSNTQHSIDNTTTKQLANPKTGEKE